MRRIYLAVALLFAHALQGGTLAPPAITSQTGSFTAVAPRGAGFSVVATGSGPLYYQWQASTDGGASFVNLVPATGLSGQNSRSLRVLSSSSLYATGTIFKCVVSNAAGLATSANMVLTVNTRPSIATQPASVGATPGGTASFTVVAAGTGPFSYQWRKNNVAIPGQTAATLTITGATQADVAAYTVVVTNLVSSVTSKAARFILGTPPTITMQPTVRIIPANTGTTYNVRATGTGPLGYQWQMSEDGGPFEDLANGSGFSGVSTPTLKLGATNADMSGRLFRCIVTNLVGSVISAPALLFVQTRPGVTFDPQVNYATTGSSFTFTPAITGSAPMSFQWSFNGRPITGATGATLTLPSVTTANAGAYAVRVMNGAGTVASRATRLIVGAAPSITTPPTGVTVEAPAKAVISLRAGGNAPLTYQWEFSTDGGATFSRNFDNDEVFGVTTNTLTHNPTSPAQNGRLYRCVITNAFGTITSAAVTLTVNSPPNPFTWTLRSGGELGFDLYTVQTNGQIYVAGGVTPTGAALVVTSPDGENWTQQVSPANFPIYAMAYGKGLFVATGSAGQILTSPDGVTWTVRQTPSQLDLFQINFNGNQFVIAAIDRDDTFVYGGELLNSSNGITWTVRDSTSSAILLGITWGAGIFVASGGSLTGEGGQVTRGSILASGNGATWITRVSDLNGYMWSVAFGERMFVSVGQNGQIFNSRNTVSWSRRISGTVNELLSVNYVAGEFLALGANGTMITSPDGISWALRPALTTANLWFAVSKGNQVVVVGDDGTIYSGVPAGEP